MPTKDATAVPSSESPLTVDPPDNETAGKWAKRRRTWVAAQVDVIRGYGKSLDLFEITIRIAVLLLGAYSIYLMYCESCKDEYYELAKTLRAAAVDAMTATRGSAGAEAAVLICMVWLLTVLWMRQRPKVYLVDFKTYRHATVGGDPKNTAGEAVGYDKFLDVSRIARHTDGANCFTERSMEFQEKIIRTSCIGEKSIFPPSIFGEASVASGACAERDFLSMKGAREEAELMMFRAVEDLLIATKTRPEDVDILIVNCSLFCPTPSLSAMIVNKFGMRSDILSYNLGGMGCSASVIAVDLAAKLLTSADNPNCRAIVVSTENITQNWYRGNDRSMLLSNCLFRCGAAAILLSNRKKDAGKARFRLLHTVRTHMGKSDECYRAVFQEEDDEGVRGVRLSKQIMQIAGDALKRNITNLGPLVLPVSEQIKFFCNLLARKALRGQLPLGPLRKPLAAMTRALVPLPIISTLVGYKPARFAPEVPPPKPALPKPSNGEGGSDKKEPAAAAAEVGSPGKAERDKAVLAKELPPLVPDFTKAFEWICVHTGGRAVIDAIENNLNLPSHVLEPSRLSLYQYGNVSSASIWYELELVAEHGNMCGAQREDGAMPPGGEAGARRLSKGDRIWQIAFGSGFKCNSAVWTRLR